MILAKKIIPNPFLIFQKIKKYLKENRFIKSKDLIKVLLADRKQDRLPKILNNKKVLSLRR